MYASNKKYVDNRYPGIVRNAETIKSTNLGHLTLDHLMASVRKFVNGGENLEGNLPLLQMWYYEKWRVHQLDSTISYASRLRPLIQNWSDEKAQKVDNIINKNYIGVGEYVDDLLRPFNPPPVRTPFKPKIDGKDKAVIGCVLAYLKEGASIVVDAVIEIMRHDHPKNTRDRQLVYIERVRHRYARKKWKFVNGEANLEGNLPLLQYVEDLMRPFIPAQDGTLAKPKIGAQVVDAAIDLMRHDEPTDTRDGQLVFIERVAGIIKLKRDGRIEKCYQDALAGIPETTQGTSYLKHDMVFLPTRSSNVHWFLVVVNPKRKEFSALYMLKNIELFTGEKLRM
ncbi:hypothetical protein ZWY2020_040870 [Hordeum vulgare]|nr:hypothetical protein ZWY2020_040870 [Hordeum vulgare]